MIRTFLFLFLAAVGLVLVLPGSSPARALLTLTSAQEGVYVLRGLDIADAAALEINLAYDPATLSNPRIASGALFAGALSATNPNTPGVLRTALIRTSPVTGSGIIATITFDRSGISPGRILSLKARLANAAGAVLPLLVQLNIHHPEETPEDAPASVPNPATPAQGEGPASPSSPRPITGLVLLSAGAATGEKGANEQKELSSDAATPPAKDLTSPLQRSAEAAGGATPTQPAPKSREILAFKSVLDRFKEFKGKKTPQALMALFDQQDVAGSRQEPVIARADGKSKVVVTFSAAGNEQQSTDVAVMGAKLLSQSGPDKTNRGKVELLPFKDECRVSIAIAQDVSTMVYPVTVTRTAVVDLDGSGSVTEEDFNRFLHERGGKNDPRYDLNGDGKRDYLDDYIYTANYLIERNKVLTQRTPK